jgi:hypothetical protein
MLKKFYEREVGKSSYKAIPQIQLRKKHYLIKPKGNA